MEVDVKPNEGGNTDLKKQRNKNFLIVVAVILLTAGGTSIVLALLIQESGEETSNMKALIEAACEAENPTIVDINTCSQADCTFDTSICEIPCPFDYLTDESECPVSCECADHGLYQGDVAFLEEEVMDMAERYGYVDNVNDFALFYGTLKTNVRLWTDSTINGRYQVPYKLDSTAAHYTKLINSMQKVTKLLSERTCIDLVKQTNEKHYLLLWDDGRSCSSFKGSIVDYLSPQKVSLTQGCHHFSTVQHEIMHALGFSHKHVRPDRDAYIEIFWDNVDKKRVNNFARIAKDKVIKSNVLYEIKSIMHYSSSYFTIVPGEPSMLERGTGANIPQRDFEQEYTDADIQVLNSAYDCLKTSYTARYANWGPWSPCDETCGLGEKHRYRKCQDSQGQYAKGCRHGEAHETQKCEGPTCTSSEQWLSWGQWGDCKGSCGFGYRIKSRKCSSRPSACGSKNAEHETCDMCGAGAVETSNWGAWSACSATCNGERKRKMVCEDTCMFNMMEKENCNTGFCNVGGGSGSFSPVGGGTGSVSPVGVGAESVSPVGGGTGSFSPVGVGTGSVSPVGGGTGSFSPVGSTSQGGWGSTIQAETISQGGTSSKKPWGLWASCSATCDGTRKRKRKCGSYCSNAEEESEKCNVGLCNTVASGDDDGLFERNAIAISGYLCSGGSGSKWVFGDFNADGRRDVLCYEATGDVSIANINRSGRLDKISSRGRITGCDNGKKYVGDFNGDGRDDILCKNEVARKLTVNFMTSQGSFDLSPSNAGDFCTDSSDRLIIMDVNMDDAMDLLCHFNDKHIEVRLNVKNS